MKINIINGPNLNLLGIREKSIYGIKTYRDLELYINEHAIKMKIDVKIAQYNSEESIIEAIHKTRDQYFYGIILILPLIHIIVLQYMMH